MAYPSLPPRCAGISSLFSSAYGVCTKSDSDVPLTHFGCSDASFFFFLSPVLTHPLSPRQLGRTDFDAFFLTQRFTSSIPPPGGNDRVASFTQMRGYSRPMTNNPPSPCQSLSLPPASYLQYVTFIFTRPPVFSPRGEK